MLREYLLFLGKLRTTSDTYGFTYIIVFQTIGDFDEPKKFLAKD